SPVDRYSRRGHEIDSADDVVVTVQHIVLSAPQLRTQGADEVDLPRNRNRRMNHARAECARLLVQLPPQAEGAVKGPINGNTAAASKPKHAHQPVFHGAMIEVFDDVQDLV